MAENVRFTGEITPESVVANAKRASAYIVGQGIVPQTELEFHYPPLPHDGSDARYILEMEIGENVVYVAVMPPNGSSTEHFHEEPVKEKYVPLEGQLFINSKSIADEGITIFSNTIHRATTNHNEGALTVIVMENGALKSPEERHKR